MSRRVGTVTVSYGVIEQALHLPEAHRIRGMRLVDSFSETFEIMIEGPSLSEIDDHSAIPRVQYQITVTEDREQLVPARTFTGTFNEETRQ